MEIQRCTKADFDQILTHVPEFWGDDRARSLHHPMFVYEFGDSAYVMRDGAGVAAYLFGFIAQTGPTGYVHLIAVRVPYRRRGLARRLYDRFREFAVARGCTELKAITTPDNTTSIAFHRSLGMEVAGESIRDGTPVVRDYSGPGEDRVVFRSPL